MPDLGIFYFLLVFFPLSCLTQAILLDLCSLWMRVFFGRPAVLPCWLLIFQWLVYAGMVFGRSAMFFLPFLGGVSWIQVGAQFGLLALFHGLCRGGHYSLPRGAWRRLTLAVGVLLTLYLFAATVLFDFRRPAYSAIGVLDDPHVLIDACSPEDGYCEGTEWPFVVFRPVCEVWRCAEFFSGITGD